NTETPKVASIDNTLENIWKEYKVPDKNDFESQIDTTFNEKKWLEIAHKITQIPEEYAPIKKVQQLFQQREKMVNEQVFDWAMGELMAYGTLLAEGYTVRLTGQDCERGTFSHRHAVVKKEDSEAEFIPLQHVADKQGLFF